MTKREKVTLAAILGGAVAIVAGAFVIAFATYEYSDPFPTTPPVSVSREQALREWERYNPCLSPDDGWEEYLCDNPPTYDDMERDAFDPDDYELPLPP